MGCAALARAVNTAEVACIPSGEYSVQAAAARSNKARVWVREQEGGGPSAQAAAAFAVAAIR